MGSFPFLFHDVHPDLAFELTYLFCSSVFEMFTGFAPRAPVSKGQQRQLPQLPPCMAAVPRPYKAMGLMSKAKMFDNYPKLACQLIATLVSVYALLWRNTF